MKNRVLFIVFILFIGFMLGGCVKHYLVNEQDNGRVPASLDFSFKVKNGMLSFPTLDDYQKAIDYLVKNEQRGFVEWDKLIHFKSQRVIKETGAKTDNFVDDEILASLLNKDGEIEIAGKVYKVDVNTKKVYVLNSEHKAVEQYSFDDDVLEISMKKRKGCPKYIYDDPPYNYPPNNLYYLIFGYRKYGIYFTLIAKITSKSYPVSVLVKYDYMAANGRSNSSRDGWVESSDTYAGASSLYKALERPYAGTSRLTSYKFCAKFYYKPFNWDLIRFLSKTCDRIDDCYNNQN